MANRNLHKFSFPSDDVSSDEEIIVTNGRHRGSGKGNFSALQRRPNASRGKGGGSGAGRSGVRGKGTGRIEASMRKAFSESRGTVRPTRPSTHIETSPTRSPFRHETLPPRGVSAPPRGVSSGSPPEIVAKLDAIDKKLNILAHENEKVSLGQAVIGRQLDLLVTSLLGDGGDGIDLASLRAKLGVRGDSVGEGPGEADAGDMSETGLSGEALGGNNGSNINELAGDALDGNNGRNITEDVMDSSTPGAGSEFDLSEAGGEDPSGNQKPHQKSMTEILFGDASSPGGDTAFGSSDSFVVRGEEEMGQTQEDAGSDSEDEGKFKAINQFRLIDKDGSGALDLEEILAGAKILGLSVKEARGLYEGMDKNSSGEVSMEDYLLAYQNRGINSEHSRGPAAQILNGNGEWMINPRHNFRLTWDLGLMMPFLVYLTIVLPFRLTFANEAPVFTWVYWFEFMIDLLFIVDMGFNFRTGIVIETRNAKGESYEAVEFDRKFVAMNYVKSWFFIDFFSGVPFSLIDLATNGQSPNNAKSLKALRFLKLARLLKLGRLLKIEKILASLERDTLDRIEDFFTDGASLSINSLITLLLALAFVVHLMACGFVVVGKASDESGHDSWLHYELRGPFTSRDTTGLNGDNAVYSIYVAAFYFCLTTMTSVGYGDILPRNNSERIFVIFLEFASSIVFATIIGLITAVVTSLDMGAKKKAEDLAEVSSFIAFRRFPEKLSRRIRRHFRNFYSLKTAMDEKKIFKSLSTALRKDVSEFLVFDLMGSDSFFMTVSTTLWPRLLPLLQPMMVEGNEKLCKQGEECEEMYVLINGMMMGYTHLPSQDPENDPPIVQRRLTKGDSVNVLCVLEIWYKCVETVVSGRNLSETYAVKSEEFVALFQSDMDMKNFTNMQKREIKKFYFDSAPDAPTNLGMPVYMSCFSSVLLSLEKVFGPVLNLGDHVTASRTLAWVVVDLTDNKNGNALNDFWSHSTTPTAPEVRADGSLVLHCSEEIRWTDVSISFRNTSVRARLYVSDASGGSEHLAASASISLLTLFKNTPQEQPSDDLMASQISPQRAVAWVDLTASRPSHRHSHDFELGGGGSGSGPLGGAAALTGTVHFGEEWGGRAESASALKLLVCVRRPAKKRKMRRKYSTTLSAVAAASASPRDYVPPQAPMEEDDFRGTMLGSSARSAMKKRTNSLASEHYSEDNITGGYYSNQEEVTF